MSTSVEWTGAVAVTKTTLSPTGSSSHFRATFIAVNRWSPATQTKIKLIKLDQIYELRQPIVPIEKKNLCEFVFC